VGLAWTGLKGRGSGIRVLSSDGRELRFIDTHPYLPTSLCFDPRDNLWSLGWQRGAGGESEEQGDYAIVRRFSDEGKQTGAYVPRSLWRNQKASPGTLSRNYWSMQAAADRIGGLVYENHAGHDPEWLVWDLDGRLLSRTALPRDRGLGRAFTADGRLYARFPGEKRDSLELRVLDTVTGTWTSVADNLPERERAPGLLLGADGNDLVYKMGPGMVRLLRVRPGSGY
jgi:hypothetical protein